MTVTVPQFGKIAASRAARQVEAERKLKAMTTATESEFPERGDALSRLVEGLDEIAGEFGITTFENGTAALDFALFELLPAETVFEERGFSVEEVRRLSPPEKGAEITEATKSLEKRGIDSGALFATGDAETVPTQRSGGLYRSSIILDENGTVVEYNLRTPPVDTNARTKNSVERDMKRLRGAGWSSVADADKYESDTEVFVRRYMPLEKRKDVAIQMAARGIGGLLPPDSWCGHFRAVDCSIPLDDMLTFIRYVVSNYNRFFPAAREWSNPAVDGLVWGGVEAALEALESVTTDYEEEGGRGREVSRSGCGARRDRAPSGYGTAKQNTTCGFRRTTHGSMGKSYCREQWNTSLKRMVSSLTPGCPSRLPTGQCTHGLNRDALFHWLKLPATW